MGAAWSKTYPLGEQAKRRRKAVFLILRALGSGPIVALSPPKPCFATARWVGKPCNIHRRRPRAVAQFG